MDSKYFDYGHNCPINIGSDGCELAEWDRLYGKMVFAWHPKGFKIFLSPDRMLVNDEYMELDPYNVEKNINSDFTKRRIDITIDLLKKAAPTLQGSPKILDLGCGQGHITNSMFQVFKSGEFTGLDYSVSAIEYASDHFPGIDFSVGDAYDAPYSREYFDVVVCNNLWEHVPDPVRLLGRVKLLLKHDGYFIMSTPSRYRIYNLIRALIGKPVILISKHHVTEYTVGQVMEQLAYQGFQTEMILSRPISGSMKFRLARRLFTMWISTVRSHHQLEDTVFYLARKSPNSSE